MRIKFFITLMAVTAGLMTSPLAAMADTFVYQDPDYGYKLSYPDNWRLNVPDSGHERFRIAPMHGQDKAECSMSAVKDGRLSIYPEKYLAAASPIVLDDTFWARDVLPNYENYHVLKYHAPAGLGQGYATSVQITWNKIIANNEMAVTDVTGDADLPQPMTAAPKAVQKQAVTDDPAKAMRADMVATIYGGNRYLFTCQARADRFEKWKPIFGSILSSVHFKEKYPLLPTGYYRNFLADEPLLSE